MINRKVVVMLECLVDITIGTGAGRFSFLEGQRVRPDTLAKLGIKPQKNYFAEVYQNA